MLGDFENYLVHKALIKDNYISFYIRWVSYCYSFLEMPDNIILTSDQVQSYLTHISKTRQDWQVKQAETALRLYEYYLSSSLSGAPVPSADSATANKKLWAAAEKSMRDALRLRHRSYSTERTYVGWLWSFFNCVGAKPPSDLSVGDMQNFLSSLALKTRL